MPPPTPSEGLAGFATAVQTYEHRIGHVCRSISTHLPPLLAPSLPSSGGVILDNACGTGAVSASLLTALPKTEIYASDIMPGMVAGFQSWVESQPAEIRGRVRDVRVEDAEALSYGEGRFDGVVTNFGIFFFPEAKRGAGEMFRTLKEGGRAVVTVWKRLGFEEMLWEVQRRVGPVTELMELPLMERWKDGRVLEETMREAGFRDVELRVVEERLEGEDREDFKAVLGENFGALVSREWTEEERGLLPRVIREVVDEMMETDLVTDGQKVGCRMEAWIAVCTK